MQTFFAEFMGLFFPAADQVIDFTHLEFLQQEIFTDLTAGEKHEVDLLVETRLKDEPGLILIHVEPQTYVTEGPCRQDVYILQPPLREVPPPHPARSRLCL